MSKTTITPVEYAELKRLAEEYAKALEHGFELGESDRRRNFRSDGDRLLNLSVRSVVADESFLRAAEPKNLLQRSSSFGAYHSDRQITGCNDIEGPSTRFTYTGPRSA